MIISEHRDGNKNPLLFPSADLKRNALQESLTEAGISVDVIISYKTIPQPNFEAFWQEKFVSTEGRPDILVFFSPSGVNAVISHLSDLRHCKVGIFKFAPLPSLTVGDHCLTFVTWQMVAIGPTTEAALKDNGLVVFATAENPSPSGLVEAIQVALKKIPTEDCLK